jgi:hypothetical protein
MMPTVFTIALRRRLRRPAFRILPDVAHVQCEPNADAVPLLTARDYSRLKALLHRLHDPADPVAQVLADKLGRSRVVPPSDIPPWIAALGARVVFATEDGIAASCNLVMPEDDLEDGSALAVPTSIGAALLGAAVGNLVEALGHDGRRVTLHLLTVHRGPSQWLADGVPADRCAGVAALRTWGRYPDTPLSEHERKGRKEDADAR